jgi:hypothetical protein
MNTWKIRFSKKISGAKVTWAFSWLALHDERPNHAAIRKQVVGYPYQMNKPR